jgi:protein O-GlcNAcase/histone acetyltransferase
LKRPVTIWDNLNANDYDQRHLCLGPFTGRSSDLSFRLSGMLINPNCEFELNFIPLGDGPRLDRAFFKQSVIQNF